VRSIFHAISILTLLATSSANAAETASFIEGTYASKKGCEMLKALQQGTPRNLQTVPETLDKSGFAGWEGSCEFVKIFKHGTKLWTAIMYCVEGATAAPSLASFLRHEDGSYDVSFQNAEQPEVFMQCTN